METKKNSKIKIIVEQSNERIDLGDFVKDVLEFQEEKKRIELSTMDLQNCSRHNVELRGQENLKIINRQQNEKGGPIL